MNNKKCVNSKSEFIDKTTNNENTSKSTCIVFSPKELTVR